MEYKLETYRSVAIAAGYEFRHEELNWGLMAFYVGNEEWHPVSDSGDALRLAAAMNISIHFGNDGNAFTSARSGEHQSANWYHHAVGRDLATRMAIFEVAVAAASAKEA